jgi:hypothetical protein
MMTMVKEKQNVYDIIEEDKLEVTHKTEKAVFTLPGWLKEAAGALDDETDLLNWATEQNVLHHVLMQGLKHIIIDIRAIARPRRKTDGDSMVDNFDELQNRVSKYTCPDVVRPSERSKATSLTDSLIQYYINEEGLTKAEAMAKFAKVIARQQKKGDE